MRINNRLELDNILPKDEVGGREPVTREVLASIGIDNLVEALQVELFEELIESMNSPEFKQAVSDGKITYATIKPSLKTDKLPAGDNQAAEKLKSVIEEEFEILHEVTTLFTIDDLKEFYAVHKEKLSGIFLDDPRFDTAWEKMTTLQAGPTTLLLLHQREGGAVQKWRQFIGATDPREAEIGTLRGDFGGDLDTNLVHGSDSEETLLTEIEWVKKMLEKWLELTSPKRAED